MGAEVAPDAKTPADLAGVFGHWGCLECGVDQELSDNCIGASLVTLTTLIPKDTQHPWAPQAAQPRRSG